MRTYLIIHEFTQKRNKKGGPYGWHHAQLGTPETKWSYDFITSSYSEAPSASWEKITDNVLSRYPGTYDKEICFLLGMRVLSHDPKKLLKGFKSSGNLAKPAKPG